VQILAAGQPSFVRQVSRRVINQNLPQNYLPKFYICKAKPVGRLRFFKNLFFMVKKTTAGLASKILSGYWMLRFQFFSIIIFSTNSKRRVYDLLHNEFGGFYTFYHCCGPQCRQALASQSKYL